MPRNSYAHLTLKQLIGTVEGLVGSRAISRLIRCREILNAPPFRPSDKAIAEFLNQMQPLHNSMLIYDSIRHRKWVARNAPKGRRRKTATTTKYPTRFIAFNMLSKYNSRILAFTKILSPNFVYSAPDDERNMKSAVSNGISKMRGRIFSLRSNIYGAGISRINEFFWGLSESDRRELLDLCFDRDVINTSPKAFQFVKLIKRSEAISDVPCCEVLDQVATLLSDPAVARYLPELERRFEVSRLPASVATSLTGRAGWLLGIAIASQDKSGGLDPALAEIVAAKVRVYMAAKKSAMATKVAKPYNILILNRYFRRL
jgi:hypothetical protein